MSLNTEQVWEIGDCLELLPSIPDKSIDMILTDLPYGTTACSWDTIIPFEPLWVQYKRIIKDNGAIVLTGSQPFTSALILSNVEMFRYELIWNKKRAAGFLNSNKMPLKTHENILLFYKALPVYNPSMTKGKRYDKTKYAGGIINKNVIGTHHIQHKLNNGQRFPISILSYSQNWTRQNQIHPTQKPVSLFEYLIKTYTNEGDTVHDSCLGSGTTLEACLNTNRNCIGFEISDEWESHYRKRLKSDNSKLTDNWRG